MSRRYAYYILAVMVGINFLNYVDRWVLAAANPLIEKEFHLNDFQVGLLGTAFLVVYAIGAIPFGLWADRGMRRRIIGIAVTVWSFATLASGFVGSYAGLFLTRAVVGVGEAGYYPAGTSLLGDYFPKAQRGRTMAVWTGGALAGIAAGFAGGGVIAKHFGWRPAFFLTAIPGVVCAVLAFTMREPLRGSAEERGPRLAVVADARLGNVVGLLRIKSLRATIFAQVCLYFVVAANAFYLPTSLGRRFALDVAAAGILSGAVLVVAGIVGTVGGGFLGDYLSRRTAKGNLWVGVGSFLGAIAFVTIAIISTSLAVVIPTFFIAVVLLSAYSGPFTAISQNVVVPSLRGSSTMLTLFIAHLFGDAFSTAIVGFLSVLFGNLQVALLVTSGPLLLAAAAIAATGLGSIERDTLEAESTWAVGPLEPVPMTA